MNKISNLQNLKIFTFFLAIIFLFSFSPQKPKSSTLGIPYGGKALYINPLCIGGVHVVVGPPKPLSIFQSYNATAYRLWGPYKTPGQQGLGKAMAFSPCLVYCGIGVCYVGGGPIVMIQGTSQV